MNFLELTPHPAANAYEHNDRVVLIRPKPVTRGLRAPFDWLIYALAPRRLHLDDVGSFCWRQMDGRRTAGDIAEALRTEFGDSVEPAEERLGQFVRLMQREELVTFPELKSKGEKP